MDHGYVARARQHAERGQYRKARAAYAKAAAQSPSGELLIEFGVLEAEHGQLAAARRLFTKALKLLPNDPSAHMNLAEVASLSEDFATAERHYRAVLANSGNDVDALYGLGNALRAQDKMAEALPHLDRAHALNTNDPEILNALAIVLEAESQTGRAMQCYHRALTLAPDYYEAWCNYAQLLFHERHFADAAKTYESAEKHSAGGLTTNYLLNWAVSLSFSDNYDKAFEIVQRAIDAGDQPANAQFVCGSLHLQYGNFEVAMDHLNRAIELNPDIGEAYEKLSRINQLDPASEDRLRRILAEESLSDSNRTGAGFALYKLLDRAGDHEGAFEALRQANAIKAAETPFVPDEYRARITRSIEVFDRSFFERHAGEGLSTSVPVFVLGMPRSGTTLVEQLLAAYETVQPCGEQQDFQHLAASLKGYPDNLDVLPADWARAEGERILAKMLDGHADARIATNKSPGNYAYIGLIAWIFPQARIVYCKRDPRDIGLSSFEQNFHGGLSYTYELEAFALAYLEHERIMRHWMELAPVGIHVVEYEKLVADQEREARAMVEFCGLEWSPDCLDTTAVKRPIETASMWQARQPISMASVGKWKRYEHQLQPMIRALGME